MCVPVKFRSNIPWGHEVAAEILWGTSIIVGTPPSQFFSILSAFSTSWPIGVQRLHHAIVGRSESNDPDVRSLAERLYSYSFLGSLAEIGNQASLCTIPLHHPSARSCARSLANRKSQSRIPFYDLWQIRIQRSLFTIVVRSESNDLFLQSSLSDRTPTIPFYN